MALKENLAQRFERAQIHFSAAEDEVTDAIVAVGLTLRDWDDWHYDPYDGRLTITGCGGITNDQKARLSEHGFSIIVVTGMICK